MSAHENEVEQALREALRREPAPEGLAERILQRAGRQAPSPLRNPIAPWWRLPALRWAVAAVAIACAGGAILEHRQQQLRGEQARQQVLLALRITGSRLRIVQEQVVKANEGEETHP